PKRADREKAKIGIEREEIDNVAHFAEHNRAQRQQDDQTEHERHPAHLHKIGGLKRLHADVMIEVVDLGEMLPMKSAALNFVSENVEIEPVGILGCDQMHFPKWKKDRHRNRDCCSEEEQPRPNVERFLQEPELLAKKT